MDSTEFLHITDLEAAINYWRQRTPALGGVLLQPAVRALAEVYGHMAFARLTRIGAADISAAAMQAWLAWYDSQPDTPCIAICSTSQGDDLCKGCGRSFTEVQHWLSLSPLQKRAVWQRIQQQATALRFTRYPERAGASSLAAAPAAPGG